MKVKFCPVQVAGLEGGSSADPLFVVQTIGQPVAVIVFGGFWESKMGFGRLAT